MSKRPTPARLGLTAGLTGLLSLAAVVAVPGGAVAQQYPPTAPPGGTAPGCTVAATRLDRSTITAGSAAPVSVTGAANSVINLLAATRPDTAFRVVRSAELGEVATANFLVTPPRNTRLAGQQRGCAFGRETVLNVRPAISISARRNASRDYTFSGRILPARAGGQLVSLYRVTPQGRQVLTSQTRASGTDGRYSVNRRFTGSGRFGFVVRTGNDLLNAPGSSNVRSLLVF